VDGSWNERAAYRSLAWLPARIAHFQIPRRYRNHDLIAYQLLIIPVLALASWLVFAADTSSGTSAKHNRELAGRDRRADRVNDTASAYWSNRMGTLAKVLPVRLRGGGEVLRRAAH